MRHITPTRLVILAILLLVIGVVLPFLMVMKVIESTFLLNFVSFLLSLVGIIIGVIGAAYYVRINRSDR